MAWRCVAWRCIAWLGMARWLRGEARCGEAWLGWLPVSNRSDLVLLTPVDRCVPSVVRTVRFMDGPDEVHREVVAKLELRKAQATLPSLPATAKNTRASL